MTKKLLDRRAQQQSDVGAYFQAESSYWQEVYTIPGVQPKLIRDRHTLVLDWVAGLALPPGSRVLEVGCGAGFMSIALARLGLQVCAIDSVAAMVELACRNAEESGVSSNLSCGVGDAYSLEFDDASFDLVLAIGLIPWLEEAEQAIQEMARVTKPGGYIILTTANRAGLAYFLDPLMCPLLRPIKLYLKNVLVRLGLHSNSPTLIFHGSRNIDRALGRLAFVKIKGVTRGFAFSFFRHLVLPEKLVTAINARLQRLADRNLPWFRSSGVTYFVLARKVSG